MHGVSLCKQKPVFSKESSSGIEAEWKTMWKLWKALDCNGLSGVENSVDNVYNSV